MEELQKIINEQRECIQRMDAFLKDVMPQIGRLCVQDYQNLNELCIAVSKLK